MCLIVFFVRIETFVFLIGYRINIGFKFVNFQNCKKFNSETSIIYKRNKYPSQTERYITCSDGEE